MKYSQSSVREWKAEAQKTLEQAQGLCSNAQHLLNKTTDTLVIRLPGRIEYLETLLNGWKELLDRTRKIVEAIRNEANSLKAKSSEIAEMETSILELDAIITKLQAIKVPQYVLSSPKGVSKALVDFISLDSILMLKNNFATFKANHAVIDDFMDQKFDGFVTSIHESSMLSTTIQKQFADEVIPLKVQLKSHDSTLSRILKENASLENELISMLEMLTNHYDQCNQAVQHFNDATQENLDILYADALELPEVLKELHTVCDIIYNNETRGDKLTSAVFASIEVMISTVQKGINSLRSTKTTSIPELFEMVSHFKGVLADEMTMAEYLESLKLLTYHYTQFVDVYNNEYIKELYYERYVYPRKFLDRLHTFLNEELNSMQVTEINRRKKWLAEYGQFIPRELALPGEKSFPVISEVITEGLEHIEEGDKEEKQLTKLLRDMTT